MAIKPALNQFNGGEISPQLEGRYDWDSYNYSAKLCKNFIPLVEGSLKRRGGTHFVCETEEIPSYSVRFVAVANKEIKNAYIIIDNVKYKLTIGSFGSEFESEYIGVAYAVKDFEYGEDITYTIQADGFLPVTQTATIKGEETFITQVIAIADASTLTIKPHPSCAVVVMNGVETKSLTVELGNTIQYSVSYNGTSMKGSYLTVQSNDEIDIDVPFYALNKRNVNDMGEFICPAGYYQVLASAGGGGAAGGSYDDHEQSTGGGGGAGASFEGKIYLSGTYFYKTSGGGYGGRNARSVHLAKDGGTGGDCILGDIFTLKGGKGGLRVAWKKGDGTGGKGGVATYDIDKIYEGTPKKGADGVSTRGGQGGLSTATYGAGGNGVYKENGKGGTSGCLIIRYIGESINE